MSGTKNIKMGSLLNKIGRDSGLTPTRNGQLSKQP